MPSIEKIIEDAVQRVLRKELAAFESKLSKITSSVRSAPSAASVKSKATATSVTQSTGGSVTGQQLLAARKSLGYSVKQAANKLGVAVPTYYKWEKTKGSLPFRGASEAKVLAYLAAIPEIKATAPVSDDVVITGQFIKEMRAKSGVTAAAFAKLCGVSIPTIFLWEGKKGALKMRDATMFHMQKLVKSNAFAAISDDPSVTATKAKRGRPSKKAASTPNVEKAEKKATPKSSTKKAARASSSGIGITGLQLKAFRTEKGVGIPALSKLTGVSIPSLYKWETTTRELTPRGSTASAIQKWLSDNGYTSAAPAVAAASTEPSGKPSPKAKTKKAKGKKAEKKS